MRKYEEYKNIMTDEDKALARNEEQSLGRFILALLMTLPYGAIAFFDVWKLRDVMPLLLIHFIPDVEYSTPSQLYTYISILIGGLAWFITFAILWHKLGKPVLSWKKRLITLAVWCVAAALVYVLLSFATLIVL